MTIKTGATVRLKPPPQHGVVLQRRINEGTDEIEVLVQWDEDDGNSCSWVPQDKLEEVQ